MQTNLSSFRKNNEIRATYLGLWINVKDVPQSSHVLFIFIIKWPRSGQNFNFWWSRSSQIPAKDWKNVKGKRWKNVFAPLATEIRCVDTAARPRDLCARKQRIREKFSEDFPENRLKTTPFLFHGVAIIHSPKHFLKVCKARNYTRKGIVLGRAPNSRFYTPYNFLGEVRLSGLCANSPPTLSAY